MSNKEAVIELVRSLPDDVSLEEVVEEIKTLAAIQAGVEDAEHGRVVSHEEVRGRFEAWLSRSDGLDAPSPISKVSSTT